MEIMNKSVKLHPLEHIGVCDFCMGGSHWVVQCLYTEICMMEQLNTDFQYFEFPERPWNGEGKLMSGIIIIKSSVSRQ